MVSIDRNALISTFQVESEELLSELERLALDLDERPDDLTLVSEMFRIAHTLKGGASCVGFERVVRQAHELEALFESITTRKRAPNRELTAVVLDAIDLLRTGVRAEADLAPEPIAGEEQTLQRIRDWLAMSGSATLEQVNRTANEAAPTNKQRTLRVDVDRLDSLLNLVGEVAIAEGRLRSMAAYSPNSPEASAWQSFDGLFQTLQDNVMRLRLVPLGSTLDRFRRAVRDLSSRGGQTRGADGRGRRGRSRCHIGRGAARPIDAHD